MYSLIMIIGKVLGSNSPEVDQYFNTVSEAMNVSVSGVGNLINDLYTISKMFIFFILFVVVLICFILFVVKRKNKKKRAELIERVNNIKNDEQNIK